MTLIREGMHIENVRENGVAFLLDRNGIYRGVATRDESLIVGNMADLIGCTLHEILPPALADAVLEIVERVIDTGEPQEYTYAVTTLHAKGKRVRHAWITRQEWFAIWDAVDITEVPNLLKALSDLSSEERQVWMLTCQGYDNNAISSVLDISVRTVARRRRVAFQKIRDAG